MILLIPALLVVTAAPALARGDGWQPLSAGDFEAPGCGGDIQVHFDANNEYFRFVTIGGQEVFQVTGRLVTTFTNLDTARSITLNASGPGRSPGGAFVGQGLSWFFFFPGQQGTFDLPDIIYTSGSVDLRFDDNGILQSFTQHGNLTDLCAELA